MDMLPAGRAIASSCAIAAPACRCCSSIGLRVAQNRFGCTPELTGDDAYHVAAAKVADGKAVDAGPFVRQGRRRDLHTIAPAGHTQKKRRRDCVGA